METEQHTNEWTKKLLHLRDGRSVHVSIYSDDDGREFVRLEFNNGGYVSLECDENGGGVTWMRP